MKSTRFFLFFACVSFIFASASCKAEAVSEKEAQSIGTSAYLYFYPLITMDITRKQMTNTEPGKIPGFAPMNTYANVPQYPTADMKAVVRPNFDTLYSTSWIDLTQGPVVLSVPNTQGRYYLLPLLDMWTDVFASPGWRTTGTEAADFVVVPQGWTGKLPENLQVITAPTPYVWIIGRIKTDGPKDYDAVHAIQAGLKITPLADWPKGGALVKAVIDPSVDMKTPPKEQVENMSAAQFFAYAAELLKLHPPHVTDEPMLALLKRIGFERGQSFDSSRLSSEIRSGLDKARTSALELMSWKLPTIAKVENGWSMNTDTMGVYGNYYLKRALIAREGLGANLPEDAIYPLNLFDDTQAPLTGAHRYTLHFDKDNLPPVDAFWSVTLYDSDGYQVANTLNRFALSSWMPFTYNPDGSLDLIFSATSPGADKEANWLPAPSGPFNLTMRLYAPKSEVLVGKWNPPPVKRLD
jgi:hypothetical protein